MRVRTLAAVVAWGLVGGMVSQAVAAPAKAKPNAAVQAVKATAAPATPPKPLRSFEFRGHHLGDAPFCAGIDGAVAIRCEDDELGKGNYGARSIGGVPIQVNAYNFHNGKLYAINFSVHVNSYTTFYNMLVGKYGPPDSDTMGNLRTRAGVDYDNITSVWHFAEGDLILEMRYADINTSWLRFDNHKVDAEIAAEKAAKDQAAGKSAL